MKRLFKSDKYISFIEKSVVLYFGLFLTIAILFSYIYVNHKKMLDFYERGQALHKLSVSALLLSQENFHTQLEVYEVVSSPNKSRIEDFYKHEAIFLKLLNETYAAFSKNRHDVSAEMMQKLNELNNSAPRVQKHWHQIVKAVSQNKSTADKIKLLVEAERTFDKEGFNETIKEMIAIHLKEAESNDEKIYALVSQSSVTVVAGIFLAFLLTGVMTILYRAALQGRTHQLQLVHAGKLASLGQLSAGMAHEINSPLMFITGFNNRIRATLRKEKFASDSPVWNHLNDVESGVERITKIVRHIKDFARVSNNEVSLVSINEAIKRSFTLFDEQLRISSIDVKMELDQSSPHILADANRIEQVLMNLISNARDAMKDSTEPSAKVIWVKSSVVDNLIIIQFEDTGMGINPENMSRIFDPFFTTKAMGVGTGLGLSISVGIIREYGGMIEVDSHPGQGTCFTLTFNQAEKIPAANAA